MKKMKHVYRSRMYVLFGAMLAGTFLVVACGKAEQDQPAGDATAVTEPLQVTVTPVEVAANPPASNAPAQVPVEASVSVAPAPQETVVPAAETSAPAQATQPVAPEAPAVPHAQESSKKKADEDWFAFYKAKESLRKSGKRDKAKEASLKETEEKLREAAPPHVINDSLELAAFDLRLLDTDPGEGQNANYAVTWLFHKTGDIKIKKDNRVVLLLSAKPDKGFQHYLATDSQPDRTYVEIQYTVSPELEATKEGDYFIIFKRVTLPSLPYFMRTYLSEQAKQKDGTWKYVDAYGEACNLGWRADLGS